MAVEMMLTDIHQHILYGIDDGPADEKTSLQMLRLAHEQGVAHIVCTSHDFPGVKPINTGRYLRHLQTLRHMASDEGMQVELYSGSEIMYSPDTLSALQNGMLLTLAGTKRVLIEFFPDIPWVLMKKALTDIREAGYSVVLAHLERYACLQTNGHIHELRTELGVLTQMNADTVLKSYRLLGSRWTRSMLKQRLVDLIASDSHNTTNRACRMAEAYRLIQSKYGSDYAEQLCVSSPLRLIGH